MTFAQPQLLWLALLAPAVAVAAALLWRRRLAALAAWAARGLWGRLLPGYHPGRLVASVALLALAVLGAGLALARPQWGLAEQEVERRGVDVVVILDSSLSMAAMDVTPSRLAVAEALVRRLVRELPGHRVALVQMEGTAEVLSPLTLDVAVVDLLLDGIAAGSLPNPGSSLGVALTTAAELFPPGSDSHKVVVLLSDGEHHDDTPDQLLDRLEEDDVVVHTLGVGTVAGAPVPLPGEPGRGGRRAFKTDEDGEVVISQLGAASLEAVARATGGLYLPVPRLGVDLGPLLSDVEALQQGTLGIDTVEIREERFQWPLGLAVLALLGHLALGAFQRPAVREREARA